MPEKKGLVRLPAMSVDVSSGSGSRINLLRGCAPSFPEPPPSRKTHSSTLLVPRPQAAEDNVCYMSSCAAINDIHPKNRNIVVEPWNEVDKRACDSGAGRRRRLFPRPECDLLVEMDVKDALRHRSTTQALGTVQKSQHQMVVNTGGLPICSSDELITRGVDAGVKGIRQGMECCALASPKCRIGVLGYKPPIHLCDTLTYWLTTAESNSDTDGVPPGHHTLLHAI